MVDSALLIQLFQKLKKQQSNDHPSYVAFAESLTAGLISSEFSKIPGSSAVFWGAFVVYNPIAKEKLLGVPRSLIEKCGVVSEKCALSMAEGALKVSFDENGIFPRYSLAVTGIAGPASPYDEAKVGTVYIAVTKILNAESYLFPTHYNQKKSRLDLHSNAKRFSFEGDRNAVREQTLNSGIKMLLDII